MIGIARNTGKRIEGALHLQQSIQDILSTPLGSRVMRRNYGSLIPLLIDQPLNAATKLRLFAASAHALAKWEPRLNLQKTTFEQSESGRYQLKITGVDEQGKYVSTGVNL